MTLESRLIPADFSAVPSQAPERTVGFLAPTKIPVDLDAVGFAIGSNGEGARALGVDFAALSRAGFEGKAGQTLVIPQAEGPVFIAVGAGAAEARS